MALKPWEGRFGEVRFNATDVATAVYSLFVLLFVLLFRARIPEAGLHALFNADVLLLVLLVCLLKEKWNGFRVVWLWYPLALYTFFYYQSGLLNRALVPHFLDDPFLAADVRIFGEFPGFLLHRAFPGAVANEVFHFAYFCYYLIIPFAGILLYRKGHDLFARYLLEVSVLFYVCYAIFIFLPVEGPLHLRNGFFHGSGVFERIVDFLYRKGENPGGAPARTSRWRGWWRGGASVTSPGSPGCSSPWSRSCRWPPSTACSITGWTSSPAWRWRSGRSSSSAKSHSAFP
jgi:hypothetical protein